ncbi:hypothetical protein EJ07DRAFT_162634 [Lizonia empirigonia]|nr:hypothetical protein EJ07DRAFT_162634 [Lizonia empirigonia]
MSSPTKRTPRADSQQPSAGTATLIRCPPPTLSRLRTLNEAEIITLFTPVVPHAPSTPLARDMDPFEPLGRALPRQVRHVPFRIDRGMTELHPPFLAASGVVVVVICATAGLGFARSVATRVEKDEGMVGVPVVLLVVWSGARAGELKLEEFPALVTVDDYLPATLERAARVLFG